MFQKPTGIATTIEYRITMNLEEQLLIVQPQCHQPDLEQEFHQELAIKPMAVHLITPHLLRRGRFTIKQKRTKPI